MKNHAPPVPLLKIDRLYQPQTNHAKLLEPSVNSNQVQALCRSPDGKEVGRP